MYSVDAGPHLDNEKVWLQNGQKGTVCVATASRYQQLQHRVRGGRVVTHDALPSAA